MLLLEELPLRGDFLYLHVMHAAFIVGDNFFGHNLLIFFKEARLAGLSESTSIALVDCF